MMSSVLQVMNNRSAHCAAHQKQYGDKEQMG
jgi:hypothetical protein